MFNILPKTYFWPIVAHVAEDGKVVEKNLFEAEFKRLTQRELPDLENLSLVDQIKALVVGWRGAKDMDNQDIPFAPETLSDLLNDFPEIVVLLFEAFQQSHSLVKRKN